MGNRDFKGIHEKGFALDDDRLKNLGGGNYFDELLSRIKDILSTTGEISHLQAMEKHIRNMVTGSGKTFTMANAIQTLNKPTLIIAHNKTLAGQLYGEFKEFFPNNAVEYFVSYYEMAL